MAFSEADGEGADDAGGDGNVVVVGDLVGAEVDGVAAVVAAFHAPPGASMV